VAVADLMARVALLAAVLALSVGCSSSKGPSPSGVVRRVVVLGDSLAVTPTPAQSFPADLGTRITQQGLPWTVVNAGVFGDTTAGGLRRVDPLLASDVGILVLELGANDGLDGIDPTIIRANLSAIVEHAQSRTIRVLLCGMETPPFHGVSYSLAFHQIYPSVAGQYALPLVPFLLEGVVGRPELLGPDGVHPNAAGAQRIADTVWPYLEPLLH
jgi:acyl-CoA thioesterase-1